MATPKVAPTAKKNRNVSIIPAVRDTPNAQALRLFDVTMDEYLFLKMCASTRKPSVRTARQRALFRRLEKRAFVQVGEYPFFEGQGWSLSPVGALIVRHLPLYPGATLGRTATAKVLRLP